MNYPERKKRARAKGVHDCTNDYEMTSQHKHKYSTLTTKRQTHIYIYTPGETLTHIF